MIIRPTPAVVRPGQLWLYDWADDREDAFLVLVIRRLPSASLWDCIDFDHGRVYEQHWDVGTDTSWKLVSDA